MAEMTDNKCTLRTFTKGIKPASARWWKHNKYDIEVAVFGIGCFAITALVIYLLTCVVRLFVGEGTTTTDFVGYAVFITVICLAIYFTIRRLIHVVKACCAAGEDV